MGCDIHAYIEYRNRRGRWENVQGVWTAKKHQRFHGEYDESTSGHLDRNYRMFGMLAGVRVPELQVYERRGVPESMAWRTIDAYAIAVDDKFLAQHPDYDGVISTRKANEYVGNGWSQDVVVLNSDGNPVDRRYVSGPDWHSASWLATHEYAEVLRRYNELARSEWHEADIAYYRAEVAKGGPFADYSGHHLAELESADYRPTYDVEYAAMLGAMVACEEHGHPARIVFWFDN